LTDLK